MQFPRAIATPYFILHLFIVAVKWRKINIRRGFIYVRILMGSAENAEIKSINFDQGNLSALGRTYEQLELQMRT
jgi:hypothetical protein